MIEADLASPQRWTRRPRFSPNQMLTAQQLQTLLNGQREHSAMLMRALHGRGVIFGFAVTPGERKCEEEQYERNSLAKGAQKELAERRQRGWVWAGSTRLDISCGMALDRHGRLLRWPAGMLRYRDLVGRKRCGGAHTLLVHYAERRVRKGGCGPCADHAEWDEEGVLFSLAEGCDHAERSCPDHSGCTSWDDYICARTASGGDKLPVPDDLATACEPPGELCQIECSDLWYDPAAGIPIGCVWAADLAQEGCEERWGFAAIGETCAARPYVHRTPLLYELIRGCQDDLARVESLSWQDWLVDPARQDWKHDVPWADLESAMRDPDGMTITFTKPSDVRTVHPASVFLTSVYWEKDSDYLLARRIPAFPVPIGDGAFETRFRLFIDRSWIESELASRSHFREGGRIELTIRGQMLRDACRNMLDAAPLFYDPVSPRQSQPGDDFYAVFAFGPYASKAPSQPKPKPTPKPAPPASPHKF